MLYYLRELAAPGSNLMGVLVWADKLKGLVYISAALVKDVGKGKSQGVRGNFRFCTD